ncbi:MAG: sulfurtransferase, partial [Acidobacteria bacterium]|nr:sulfurtransferase [Acidobacteriota bacterium]
PNEHTSARAAFLLDKAGFKGSAAMLGGMMAWESSGGEMVRMEIK